MGLFCATRSARFRSRLPPIMRTSGPRTRLQFYFELNTYCDDFSFFFCQKFHLIFISIVFHCFVISWLNSQYYIIVVGSIWNLFQDLRVPSFSGSFVVFVIKWQRMGIFSFWRHLHIMLLCVVQVILFVWLRSLGKRIFFSLALTTSFLFF